MKKIITFFCLLISFQIAFAQTKYVDSLKAALANTTIPFQRFTLLSKLGEDSYTSGSSNLSYENNVEMLRIAQQLKSDSLMGWACSFSGIYYLYYKGDCNTALEYYFKGIEYSEKANDKANIAGMSIDVSNAYYLLQNPTNQLNFIKKAEANLPDKNDPLYFTTLIQVQLGYALYYEKIKQPRVALQYNQASEATNFKLSNSVFESFVLDVYALAHEQLGDKELAEVYFKKSIEKINTIEFPFAKYLAINGYTAFLLNNQKYSEAKLQAASMLQLGEHSHNNFYKLTATAYLQNIFYKENKWDSAYYYSKQSSDLKDTVFNQENNNKIQAMVFKEELRTTENENKKAKAEHQRHQNIQFALIAFSIIIFIIFFLIFSRSIVANERLISFFGILGLLIVFEFINLLIHPWLASFTEESPVLMLFALVLIASLLIPIHHRLEK